MSHQLSHQENKFSSQSFPITVICDHLDSPANQGALFRVCEAFGVNNIIFFGNTIDIKSSRLKRTARSTEKLIPYSCVSDIKETIATLKQNNTRLIGLEITSDSAAIQELTIDTQTSIALIIGSEKHGISEDILQYLDSVYHITMFGNNSSMNVIQSTGIALYEITKKIIS
ncbi:SpoU rRNA methylase family protein [unidentified eubacterium SCB49]|nr:SpoU rRNA methylase family protein [unidentified eubacterium SCB49]